MSRKDLARYTRRLTAKKRWIVGWIQWEGLQSSLR